MGRHLVKGYPAYGVDGTPAKGAIAVYDGSKFVVLGVGPNGQVLTADSAQALGIKWAAAAGGGGGGGLVYLAGTTIGSPVATTEIATGIDDTYDEYELHYELVPATDNVNLQARFSSNGGSSWDSGGSDYKWHWARSRSGSTSAHDNSWAGTGGTVLLAENIGSDTGEGIAGALRLRCFRSTTMYKLVEGIAANVSDVGEAARQVCVGMRSSLSVYSGVQLFFGSGNVESGWLRLYGVRKTAATGSSVILYDSGELAAPAASIDTGAAGIAGGYTTLEVLAILRTSQAAATSTALVTVNGDTSSAYDYQRISGANATASANSVLANANWPLTCPGASAAAGVFGYIKGMIPFYAGTTAQKVAEWMHGHADTTLANNRSQYFACNWRNTVAISRLAVTAGSGSFVAGSRLIIYGR